MTRGELLALLERVQWPRESAGGNACCPLCGGTEPYEYAGRTEGGHERVCGLPDAIEDLRGAGHLDAEIGQLRIDGPTHVNMAAMCLRRPAVVDIKDNGKPALPRPVGPETIR